MILTNYKTNKPKKSAEIHANIKWELRTKYDSKHFSKYFCKYLKRQNMQNQTISELYTDNINS